MSAGDYLFTVNQAERDNALATGKFQDQGIVGWVADQPNVRNTMPLHRFNNGYGHLYTVYDDEFARLKAGGYNYEGVACYVFRFPVDDYLITGDPNEIAVVTGWGYQLFQDWFVAPKPTGDWFYTISDSERDAAIKVSGFTGRGDACFVLTRADGTTVPLFRLFNQKEHFFTTDSAERDNLVASQNFIYEGIACHVYPNSAVDRLPLYRLENVFGHLFTTSIDERDAAIANEGYLLEGVACYVPAGPANGTVPLHKLQYVRTMPLYRLLGPQYHVITISVQERDEYVAAGYRVEGVIGHVLPNAYPGSEPIHASTPAESPVPAWGWTATASAAFFAFSSYRQGLIKLSVMGHLYVGLLNLYRLVRPDNNFHMLSANIALINNPYTGFVRDADKYFYQGNVYRGSAPNTVPLYQLFQIFNTTPTASIDRLFLNPASVQACMPMSVSLNWEVRNIDRVLINAGGTAQAPINNPHPGQPWTGRWVDPTQRDVPVVYTFHAENGIGASLTQQLTLSGNALGTTYNPTVSFGNTLDDPLEIRFIDLNGNKTTLFNMTAHTTKSYTFPECTIGRLEAYDAVDDSSREIPPANSAIVFSSKTTQLLNWTIT